MTSIREPGVPTQDGAEGVVAEMWEQVLDQIPDEDKPVEGDEDERTAHSDVTAWDDHDVDGLTAEEAAMHYVSSDDDDPEVDPDLTPEVRRELEEF